VDVVYIFLELAELVSSVVLVALVEEAANEVVELQQRFV
jgi:hypothetical protein